MVKISGEKIDMYMKKFQAIVNVLCYNLYLTQSVNNTDLRLYEDSLLRS
jgi:hypothetical protein